jgi:hypothetical protein
MSIASYSATLFVHLPVYLVNCSLAAYLSLIPDGEINMVATRAPALPQAPSQYISHGNSGTRPSVYELGSVHSAMKSAMTCELIALLFSKSTTCSHSSIAYLLIWPDESLLLKMSLRGWFVSTRIVWASK